MNTVMSEAVGRWVGADKTRLKFIGLMIEDAESKPRNAVIELHYYHEPTYPTFAVCINDEQTSVMTEAEAVCLKEHLDKLAYGDANNPTQEAISAMAREGAI